MMRRLASLRVRVAVAAVLIVGAALAVGGYTLVHLQEISLAKDVETSARLRARDVAGSVTAGTLGTRIPVPHGENTLAQVVDDEGAIVASSANVLGDEQMSHLVPGRSGVAATTVDDYAERDHPIRVVARRVTVNGQDYTVYVGISLSSVGRSTDSLEQLLFIGLPLLALLAGALSWAVVGRALRPVEAIRQEVEVIGAEDLHRRVPEPVVADEIGRLAHTMNAMLGRLEVATDRQRRFVADASHELRSPLTGIRTQLEVDLAHPAQVDWPAVGAAILGDTIRLQRLVEDLLVLASSDAAAHGEMQRAAVDLDGIVLAEARRARNHTPLTIDTRLVSGAQVEGNPDELSRVLRNLLDNAVRHAHSTITITLAERATEAVLTIADDGPGVPLGEEDRIFERFARHDAGRARDDGGTGLGLAIARAMVVAHHGTITLEPGPGAHFTVRLPLADAIGDAT